MAEVKDERFTGQNKTQGVNRVKVNFNYEGLNWDFIKLLAEIAAYATGKYGSAEQYVDIIPKGEQSPLNHIFEHMRQYIARELHDKFGDLKHHLAAIAYNAMMEFYYLEHGGPTVTDKLYRKDEPDDATVGAPCVIEFSGDVGPFTTPSFHQSIMNDPIDPPTPLHESLLNKFFGGLGGRKGKGTVPEAGE